MVRRTSAFVILCIFTGLSCAQDLIKIAEITGDKKERTVKLSGTINSFRASDRDNVPNSFNLKDETGEIRIAVWNEVLNKSSSKAAIKDTAQAEIIGKVSEYRGKLEIHVDTPAGIAVKTTGKGPGAASAASEAPKSSGAPRAAAGLSAAPASGSTSIAAIDEALVDKVVIIQGKVSSVRTPRNDQAPYVVKITEGVASIDVVFWADAVGGTPTKAPRVGDDVVAKGKVNKFRESVQVRLEKPMDLTIVGVASPVSEPASTAAGPSAPGKVVFINSLSADQNGQIVTISGMVSSARAPRSETAPFNLKITDDTGSVDVVFWKDTADKLSPEQKVKVGDKVQITGKLGDYRGTIQVRVDEPDGIRKLTGDAPGITSTPVPQTSPKVSLSQIAALPAASRARVSGTVTLIEELRLGKRVQLRDRDTTTELLLWDSAEGLKPDIRFLRENSVLEVTATVEEYQGKKILTVSRPEEIVGFQL